jgi:parallel beta-helix repeat protein
VDGGHFLFGGLEVGGRKNKRIPMWNNYAEGIYLAMVIHILMNRKIAAIWLIHLIVLGVIVIIVEIAPVVRAQTTWYVDDVPGSGGPGDPPEDFTSIQDAINAAIDGDTIFVYNGTYYENLIVNKTINLTGENKNTTIIDGSGSGDVVIISSNWVNMSELKITNGGDGMGLDFVSNCKISNCNVSNMMDVGIGLGSSTSNTIASNSISDTNSGIIVTSSSSNIILNNSVSDNRYGIYIRFEFGWPTSPDNNTVIRNNVSKNTYGIMVQESSNNNITNNNVSNNSFGLYFIQSSNNTISNNNISFNGWGIELRFANENTIENNIIDDHEGGIFLESSFVNTFTHNNMTNNNYAIHVYKSSNNNTLKNNNISQNDLGIWVTSSSNNSIIKNNITSNSRDGIRIYSSSELPYKSENNIILCNIISDNLYGINISKSENNSIINNNVSSSLDYGIYIKSSSNHDIIANNLSANGGYALYIQLSFYINVNNNYFFNGSAQGIRLDESSENIIMDNNFINNSFGIDIWPSCNNNIIMRNNISLCPYTGISISSFSNNNIVSDNNVSSNDNGIYLGKASNNTIENNRVYLNTGHGIYAFSNSNNNTFRYNYIHSNDGKGIYMGVSSNINIYANNVSNNGNGINLSGTLNGKIYHNNIIGNSIQAFDETNNENQWDSGYPSGGNYWSDYNGTDYFKGVNQDIPGSDNIGDINYSIEIDSVDYYPLMGPYKPLENYTILKQGWNLISIPLIQEEQNLTRVLGSIDGYYDAVQWYEITDTNDPWKHHRVGKPYGNDLSELNETMGFWIHITQPGDTIFVFNGTQPTSNQTIQLHKGWNMVGYPSLTSYNRTEGLNNLTFDTHVDAIWTYNATTKKYKQLTESDYFEIGKGYYIHAKTECKWAVPL